MADDQTLKLYSEQELNDIVKYIDNFQHNVSAVTETIISKVHELNVSSKGRIVLTKQEGLDILNGFILYSQLLYSLGEWTDTTVRQMAPSLRLASTLGPIYLNAINDSSDATSEPIVRSPVSE